MGNNLFKNSIMKIILTVCNMIIPLIVGPYLANVLTISSYASYNKAFSLISWFVPIASFGIYNYGIRKISQVKDDKNKISIVFSQLFFAGLFSSILVTAIYLIYVFVFIGNDEIVLYVIMSIQIISSMFYVEWMNEAFENYSFITFKTIVVKLIYIVLIFCFVTKGDDLLAYAGIVSLIQLLNYLVSYVYISKRVSIVKISLLDLVKLIKPLIIMVLLTNAGMFYTYLDRLFLSYYSSDLQINYYSISLSVIVALTNVCGSLIAVSIPKLAFFSGKSDYFNFNSYLTKVTNIFYMICIPVNIGVFILSKSIIFLYSGEKYILGFSTLALFAIRSFLWMADFSIANPIIFVFGREKQLAKCQFFCGFINLFLNYLLVKFGILSSFTALLTTMISEIILIYLELLIVKKLVEVKYNLFNKHVITYFFSSLTFIPISFLIMRIFNPVYQIDVKFLIYILVIMLASIISYIILLIVFKDQYCMMLINKIKERFIKYE